MTEPSSNNAEIEQLHETIRLLTSRVEDCERRLDKRDRDDNSASAAMIGF
ncbi:hypothetical protein [Rhodococcus sp. 06-418-5]|nr:hypothetical protein [Rhodococcus sp. 06-418-5]